MTKDPRIIFVHGFGGLDNRPSFVREIDSFCRMLKRPVRVEAESWNSQGFLPDPGFRFDVAISEAEEAAVSLMHKIDSMENGETPYYIVAHSLGCRVVSGAIVGLSKASAFCRGIFYLGAADDSKRDLVTSFLPKDAKIINYYSPKHDLVLHELYYNKLGHIAGGTRGFDNEAFLNYRCAATHARKAGAVHADWSSMARPIAEMIFENEGKPLQGALGINWRMKVANSGNWWNNILELSGVNLNGDARDIQVQQYRLKGHYRVLVARNGASRWYREGHSERLSPLLSEFGIGLDSERWPLLAWN